ncbi:MULTISPECIES: flippase [unclassified Fibrobacter]|uniref:flippase n=1 Tax=unclassified Fibrobacter TaxID=2634177 RepID=UPI000913B6E5|nr:MULTISPECIES: flippase [unclassified Fibrobacter]OWV05272.1 hypothetical protein B7993_08325 [Fibrobacter sp. UWH3]SHL30857.1 Membrane protein involved in the export of O-antigen and teichoic acid [Fibrobacter sp. UWH6]
MRNSVKINGVLNVVQRCCHILIPLLIFPYLTRILGAENFGKFSFSNSIISYVILVAMLGISTYAVREGARIRDDREAISQFTSEVFSINVVSGVIAIFGLFGFVFLFPKLGEYDTLIYIMCLMVPATILGRDFLNVVYEDFLYITLRYIVIQIVGVIMVFLLVRKSEDYTIYTGIYTFTMTFGYLINLFYTRKYAPIRFTIHLNLKKHLSPILILFCGQVATIIYIQSDVTMVGIFSGDFDVGVYTLASKIYILSKSVIYALTSVAIPRIVYLLGSKEYDKYNAFSSRLFDYLLSITVPFAIGLFVFGEETIQLIGGAEYESGALSLQILSIALLVAIFAGYFCNAILVPNRQEKKFLNITIMSAVLNICLNFIMIPKIGILGAAITTLISEVLVVILSFKESLKCLKLSVYTRNVWATIFGSALIVGVCCMTKCLVESSLLQLIVAIPLSALLYFVVQIVFKNDLYSKSFLSKFIKRKSLS